MASTQGLVRGFVAAVLLATVASPAAGLLMAVPAGQRVMRVTDHSQSASDDSMFDLSAARKGWLDDFQRFAENRPVPPSLSADQSAAQVKTDVPDMNVVVVAKVVPDTNADGKPAESVEPRDMPKVVTPPAVAFVPDDAVLKTGSIKSQTVPLLPPVPGPDAFHVRKGDRLGQAPRNDPAHAAPSATDAATAPHAELSPAAKASMSAILPGKSAMLLPARADKLKPVVVASATSMKPFDLSPTERPDALFQGPPMPADPTIDPDAPVLGYAEQVSSAEAPFKSLFAVSSGEKKSWLGVDTSAAAPAVTTKATKPSKVSHLVRHRSRKHDG